MHFSAPLSDAPESDVVPVLLAIGALPFAPDISFAVDSPISVNLLCLFGMSDTIAPSFAGRFRTIPAKIDFCDGLVDAVDEFGFGVAFSVLIF